METKSLQQLVEAYYRFRESSQEIPYKGVAKSALKQRIIQRMTEEDKEQIRFKHSQNQMPVTVKKLYTDGDKSRPYITVETPSLF